jgi:hypothetical protein
MALNCRDSCRMSSSFVGGVPVRVDGFIPELKNEAFNVEEAGPTEGTKRMALISF